MGRIADHRSQRAVLAVIVSGMLMGLTWVLVVGKPSRLLQCQNNMMLTFSLKLLTPSFLFS
jgi:hypothetical protein